MTADVGIRPPVAPPSAGRLRSLQVSECVSLLGQAAFGRVAMSSGGRPWILPVRVRADHTGICFASDAAAGRLPQHGDLVALEADCLQPGSVWSVVVHGTIDRTLPHSWFDLTPSSISGRRLAAGTPDSDHPIIQPGVLAGVGPLSRDDAFRLLALERVGRLAVAPGGHPLIFPVNYLLDGEFVVFRTGTGTMLHAISRSLVAFEADRFAYDGTGWSVVTSGWGQEITHAEPEALRERLHTLPLQSWAAGEQPYFVRVIPIEVAAYSHHWD